MDADRVAHDAIAHLIGLAMSDSAFDASARQPDAEGEGMMVASVAVAGVGRAAELAGPDHERFVE